MTLTASLEDAAKYAHVQVYTRRMFARLLLPTGQVQAPDPSGVEHGGDSVAEWSRQWRLP